MITAADIEAVCTRQIGNQIFDMVEAIAMRRQKQALDLYYDLLTLKEPPMRILFLIARQFNLLMQVRQLKRKGLDEKQIAEKTGLRSFVVRKYVSPERTFYVGRVKGSADRLRGNGGGSQNRADERSDERRAFDHCL